MLKIKGSKNIYTLVPYIYIFKHIFLLLFLLAVMAIKHQYQEFLICSKTLTILIACSIFLFLIT